MSSEHTESNGSMHSPKKEVQQNESTSTTEEPPRKRMKVDSPQMPHYNSHNIYSRPPLPPGSSSNSTENALPSVLAPVTPFDDDVNADDEQDTSETATNSNSTTDELKPLAIQSNDSTFIPPFDVNQTSEEWPLCEYCHKTGELSRCSSCRQAYYCNRECQVAHWEVHSIICHPGPPQPHPMPKHGQPIQPPSVYPSPSAAAYRPPPTHVAQPYHVQTPQQTHVYANGHGAAAAGYYPPPVAGGYHGTYSVTPTAKKRASAPSSSKTYYEPTIGEDGKEQYYCEECNRYFKNGQALGGHRSRVHSSRRGGDAGAEIASPYAGGVMPGHAMPGSAGTTSQRKRRPRPSRARHDANANGQYICPHCGRQFATGNALGGHISGAHTKKLRRMEQQAAQAAAAAAAAGGGHGHYVNPQQRFARPRAANI